MVAYQLAAKLPAACLEQDGKQQTPIQLASAADKGEVRTSWLVSSLLGGPVRLRSVARRTTHHWCGMAPSHRFAHVATLQVLNAMLLACAGHSTPAALSATRTLLAAGAVCDTWAPNGSSALMLAASVDCAECVGMLLDHSASLELQDALGRCAGVGVVVGELQMLAACIAGPRQAGLLQPGSVAASTALRCHTAQVHLRPLPLLLPKHCRTALMFAAGNNARAALEGLLDRGASVSIRDRCACPVDSQWGSWEGVP